MASSTPSNFPDKIIVGAGGIVSGSGLLSVIVLGAHGASVGTRFIASKESMVNEASTFASTG